MLKTSLLNRRTRQNENTRLLLLDCGWTVAISGRYLVWLRELSECVCVWLAQAQIIQQLIFSARLNHSRLEWPPFLGRDKRTGITAGMMYQYTGLPWCGNLKESCIILLYQRTYWHALIYHTDDLLDCGTYHMVQGFFFPPSSPTFLTLIRIWERCYLLNQQPLNKPGRIMNNWLDFDRLRRLQISLGWDSEGKKSGLVHISPP